MISSFFQGVSGVRGHQTKMDVVGNNVANINTAAFKSSRVTFRDVLYQTIASSAAPSAQPLRGGTNPTQIGHGVNVAHIQTLMTIAPPMQTDRPKDLYIDGEGFFILMPHGRPPVPDRWEYGRIPYYDHRNIPQNRVRHNRWHDPATGEWGYLYQILPSITPGWGFFYRWRDTNDNSGTHIPPHPEPIVHRIPTDDPDAPHFPWRFIMPPDSPWEFWQRPPAPPLYFTRVGDFGVDALGRLVDGNGKFVMGIGANGYELNWELDEYGIETSDLEILNLQQAAGGLDVWTRITQIDIGTDGIITARDAGRILVLGQVVVGRFPNPEGLSQVGNSYWRPTANSGVESFNPRAFAPGSGGSGRTLAYRLEMSNVELAKEFTTMITTQRGFQANSRTITVSDEMLQELLNVR